MKRLLSIACAWVLLAGAAGAQSEYVIGPQDVLAITVYDHADLSGSFTVDAGGALTFPLIGRVPAAGLGLRELEDELQKRLADGFLKHPQVTATVEQYRSQRIFVMGEVRSPGTYPLSGEMTILEAIARAGGMSPQAAEEVLVVRPLDGKQAGPLAPDATDGSTIARVNVREIQEGALSKNVELRGGDTVVVLRAQAVYVFGQVRTPGAYAVETGMTVLQALSLAGGVTDRGSTGRINIVRTVDGRKKEIKVKLSDLVEPGDTIIVKERFF